MSAQSFETPKIRSIIFGILVFTVLFIIAVSFSADVVKLAGAPFLFIPQKLGMVHVIRKIDVNTFSLKKSPSQVYIGIPGKYAVYADDYDLLSITNLLEAENAQPWLKVRSMDTVGEIAVSFVHRGLRPYDTLLAKGRPIFTIDIPAPGFYEFIHPSKDASISLVPDYVSGKEGILFFAYVLQILVIVALLSFLYLRITWQRVQKAREIQNQVRERHDAFWEKMSQRGKKT